MIRIDESKCKRDAICAQECPMAIIRLKDKDSYPQWVPGGEAACLLCGHCVAVCPHGALSHAKVPIEACVPIDRGLALTEGQAVQFLRSRRSARVFKDKPVGRDKVQRLIEIARYAPTGSNSQLLHWTVFTDREKIREFAGMTVDWMRRVISKGALPTVARYMPLIVTAWDAGHDVVLRDAPVLVMASAPQEAANGLVDLTISLSYLDLAAPTLGLGTCWAGLLQGALLSWPPIREAVALPEGHTHHYPMMVGYPKFPYHRLPERKPPTITWR